MSLSPGVWAVLPTPFAGPRRALDEASLRRAARHAAAAGVAGLTALGVLGEGDRLSPAERRRVLEAAAAATSLPVVAGVSALEPGAAAAEVADAAGVLGDRLAAVMVRVSTGRARALARHLRAVHDAAGTAILVQDYPPASGVEIAPAALADAVAACDFVAGVKVEAPPTAAAVAVVARRCGVPVFGGLGARHLLEELAAGAAGVMTGFSYPEALVAAVAAWRDDGSAAAARALSPWLPLVGFEAQPGVGLAIRKEILRRRGLLEEADVRPPGAPLPVEMVPALQRHVELARRLLSARR